MGRSLLKYLIALIFFSLSGIVILDYFILPNYVGYNNEHYLPDVRGEYLEKATYQLRSLRFNTKPILIPYSESHTPGTVIKMFPRAFTKVKEGRTIDLTIAGKDEDIEIPDISNLSLRNAKLTLTKLGLGIDTIIYEYDNVISDGYISFQLPRKGQTVKSSTNMTLGVSRGAPPDYYIIPDIVNYSLTRARKSIINEGLRVGEITYEFQPDLVPNTVIEQNMTAGMRVSFPASINLLISTDKQEN
ncbi:MAG TPA: PASTA domain-containing protein [Candidatus Marinimicrobia bacterium]|nr:PASTA domain-containing protein [Candidatus Neomarinimicrobiota bacterium]